MPGPPGLRDKAQALLARLEEAVPRAAAVPRCAGHGSYIPDHVILSGGRTVVIDLDEYDAADPSRDVAWFVVSLQRRAFQLIGSRDALDSAVQAFLQAYVASGPEGALANLPLYRALMYLSRARRDLYKQLPQLAEFMLDHALQLGAS
jgi:aminoglycoside phosphotransferase (APT) family kinase protein